MVVSIKDTSTLFQMEVCITPLIGFNDFCAWLVVFGDLVDCLVPPWATLINQPSFTFDFQLNILFQITLLYPSLLLAIKLPSVYYCLSVQVAYRRSILQYLMVL